MGGTSGPQRPDPARLGHAQPGACTEQLSVEGTKATRVPSLGPGYPEGRRGLEELGTRVHRGSGPLRALDSGSPRWGTGGQKLVLRKQGAVRGTP